MADDTYTAAQWFWQSGYDGFIVPIQILWDRQLVGWWK